MSNYSKSDPLTQSTFMSAFSTTRRNIFLDLLANLIIFPAYILCINQLFLHITEYFEILRHLSIIMWVAAIYPILSISGSSLHWRLGFKGRKKVFAISGALIFTFLFTDRDQTIYYFFLTVGITIGEFLIRRTLARKKFKNPYYDWLFYFLTAVCVFLLFWIVLWSFNKHIPYELYEIVIRVPFVSFLIIIIFVIYSGLEVLLQRTISVDESKNRFSSNLIIYAREARLPVVIGFFIAIIYFSIFYFSDSYLFWLCLISIGVSIPLPVFLGIQDAWGQYISKYGKAGLADNSNLSKIDFSNMGFLVHIIKHIVVFLIIIGIFNLPYFLNTPNNNFAVAILALAMILILANPIDFLSRQRANLRQINRWIRDDFIRTLVSPGAASSNLVSVITRQVGNFIRKRLNWLLYMAILILSGVVLPILLYNLAPDIQILTLLKISSVTFFFLGSILGFFILVRNRPHHIVLPFYSVETGGDRRLEVVANLIRQEFVKQLRQISLLLTLRQVENLSIRDDSGLAVFVASGGNQDLAEQLRSLGSFEAADIKIPFGNVFSTIIQRLAHTQIRGTVQRQEDNSIAIQVEYAHKNGHTIGIGNLIFPIDLGEDNDSNLITETARTLAIILVLKLGRHAHIATSFESMQAYVNGLQASYERKWWHAISNFHKAVHIEGAGNNSFGYGYYHLGALLMSQGEISEGMDYLEHAEASGPPLAETQYMLALGLYYKHQDELHLNRTKFTDIEFKCKAALLLRPDFPEAHHLLGTSYYQRGRLRERAWTRNNLSVEVSPEYDNIDPIPRHFADDYHKAKIQLLKAIKLYDRALRSLPNDINAQATIFNEQARLVEDRMAATHRLGDSLRCLGMYSEADSYYHEVLVAFQRNNRTLVDLSKTYCLAKNWGKADEYLRNELFNYPELKWNKSASFYMAWSQLGGVAENGNKVKRIIGDWFINYYERFANRTERWAKNNLIKIIWNAICWLDYALHQYPGYLYQWGQMDWQSTFIKATQFAGSGAFDCPEFEDTEKAYVDHLTPENWNIQHVRLWLAWRILGNAYSSDEKRLSEMANNLIKIPPSVFPHPAFSECYLQMQKIRTEYMNILEIDNSEGEIRRLKRRFRCLHLGIVAFRTWEKAHKNNFRSRKQGGISYNLRNLMKDKNTSLTFGERWALDVFADFSLFTVKLLVEGKAYEIARDVARDARKVLVKLIDFCENQYQESEVMFLGGKVAYYQVSTLSAWEVYNELQIQTDVATKARLNDPSYYPDLNYLGMTINNALDIYRHNPLVIFVKSMLDKERGLLHSAADGLSRLLNIVAPFDPHKFVKREMKSKVVDKNLQEEKTQEVLLPSRLYIKERVHGRQQIDFIVNLANIHTELSEIYSHLGEQQLVTNHLSQAISHSAYEDLSAELFLNLAKLLKNQEKYSEALTATEEAKDRHLYLSRFLSDSSASLEPSVLECILTTNIEDYALALKNAALTRRDLSTRKFNKLHNNLIRELREGYKKMNGYLDKYEGEVREFIYNETDKKGRIYNNESDDEKGDKLQYPFKTASYCLDPSSLANFLDTTNGTKSKYSLERIMASQVIGLLSRDLFEHLVYYCDVLNNMAFNWAELNFNLDLALDDSLEAVVLMSELIATAFRLPTEDSPLNKTSNRMAVKERRKIIISGTNSDSENALDPFKESVNRYEERLANYLDTMVWVQVRSGIEDSIKSSDNNLEQLSISNLNEAYTVLSDEALIFGSQLPIVYYHLARICVNKIELLWQGIPARERNKNKISPSKALELSVLLRTAFLYLRHAAKYNPSGSLQVRIRRVQFRLEEYRNEWGAIYQPSAQKSKQLSTQSR